MDLGQNLSAQVVHTRRPQFLQWCFLRWRTARNVDWHSEHLLRPFTRIDGSVHLPTSSVGTGRFPHKREHGSRFHHRQATLVTRPWQNHRERLCRRRRRLQINPREGIDERRLVGYVRPYAARTHALPFQPAPAFLQQ